MSEEITSSTSSTTGDTPLAPPKELESSDKPEIQPEPTLTKVNDEVIEKPEENFTDNGIFEFMTPDRAIELYQKIHSAGIPDLDWKFHGRRLPGEQERDDTKESSGDKDEAQNNENQQDQTVNTEFDFDEELSDLHLETTIVNESLSLKRRLEPGSDKKTNLSDIMSDIMKETQAETENSIEN